MAGRPNRPSGVYNKRHNFVFTLCLKNDTDVAHYNFNTHPPILVIFDRDVAE